MTVVLIAVIVILAGAVALLAVPRLRGQRRRVPALEATSTRRILFRTVLACCVPLIGNNSDSRAATLPKGANAA